MPTIQEIVYSDLKEALRSHIEPELGTLRLLKSEIQYDLTKTGAKEIPDPAMILILKKNLSQRKDSAAEYRKAGREDLAAKEEAEAVVIAKYLPEEIGEDAIQKAVDDAITQLPAKGPSDTGKVMGKVMQNFKGQNIDGSKVSEIVKRSLQALS
ncbi:GatB/YqeY domain-containing protein [Leptospira sp. GIMC2001]|uniref:GatB/YqeY domain-containing protein n=1 Tax=Leptospira sp. GIMC2001 TaxID=1513297 RepID=UPI00234A2F33|nr:GatB/YqeY domain-containing protein [Leptospira sp. GIMC2001]WCL48145.1 GatB/YqeY domain-containing protein [Leptospira sp. GIMC2001]